MFKNFLIVSFRNLVKNRLYSVINISGLAIGILCSILITLWVTDELSYDMFIPKKNELHQVWVNASFDGSITSWSSVPLPTYEAMKDADARIVNSVVTGWGGKRLLTVDDTRIITRGYYVSEEFLEMFEYPLVQGQSSSVLDDPSSILLSESMAKTLFGEQDPMGQIVKVDDSSVLKVTGIFKDVPSNSSFEFEYLIPWKHREAVNEWVRNNKDNWGNYSFQIFVELHPTADAKEVESNIKDMLTEKGQDDIERAFFLHPLPRWRLNSNFENGVETGGMSDYVQLFAVIAIFILIIACINFMNLATARSERRAKEVGIRKSVGAKRIELIIQFIGESMVISILAFILAIAGTFLILPFYNELVDKQLSLDLTSAAFWIYAAGIVFITGFISGSYPAFYLASLNVVRVLRGQVARRKKGEVSLRKALVVFQFSVSAFLIVGTLTVHQQLT